MLSAIFVAAFAAWAAASGAPQKRQFSLEEYIAREREISLTGALANIGGLNSSKVPGADPGIVVASPSTVNPNYFYTWTRDSALTYTMLIDELIFGNQSLQQTIEDYTEAQAVLQTVDNPSGTLWPAGLGLAEPKFYTNKTRFNGLWGRPQRDGPALRAIAFLELSFELLDRNETSDVAEIYWPLILNDLRYVGQYWNQSGYDLWEEVHGSSFFTINSQHRALVEGQFLAERINETCDPCGQAPEILCFLTSSFYNETGGYITADVNVNQVNRSGINTDQILGSIHVFDAEADCETADFQPCNSQMLQTFKVVVDSFRDIYPINEGIAPGVAIAVGRYPEDTYYFGNPWYITTLACAEFLYDAVAQLNNIGSLSIDEYSIDFFLDIYPNATEGAVYENDTLAEVLDLLTTYADGFVEVIQTYTPPNGSLSEQFNRTTGRPLSAQDLTWSYASFVTMAQRRSGQYPRSWGANSTFAQQLPENGTCSGQYWNSTGEYSPALAAGASAVNESCASEVFLSVISPPGGIYLVGNASLLGGAVNDLETIILPANPGNNTADNPEWFIDIWLPAGITVEYQWVFVDANNTFIFENITRIITVPDCGSGELASQNVTGSFPPS